MVQVAKQWSKPSKFETFDLHLPNRGSVPFVPQMFSCNKRHILAGVCFSLHEMRCKGKHFTFLNLREEKEGGYFDRKLPPPSPTMWKNEHSKFLGKK